MTSAVDLSVRSYIGMWPAPSYSTNRASGTSSAIRRDVARRGEGIGGADHDQGGHPKRRAVLR